MLELPQAIGLPLKQRPHARHLVAVRMHARPQEVAQGLGSNPRQRGRDAVHKCLHVSAEREIIQEKIQFNVS